LFRFEHIAFLYAGIVAVIILIILQLIYGKWRAGKQQQLVDKKLLPVVIADTSKARRNFKFILLLLAVFLLFVSMANLQYGLKEEEVKQKGIDLMIALDVSNSMNAEDLKPNRLERAKRAIEQLIDKLHGDRIGIIVFAGDAYVQLPITTDYAAAKMYLQTIDTDIVPTQGTAIGTAIDLAMQSFNFEDPTSKAIIIITDGENHEDNPVEAAQNAAENGVYVYTIGMGTPEGAPIPVYKHGKQVGFKKDKEGNTVVSHLNEEMLKEIAQAGNGMYVRATNSNVGLNMILNKINELEKKEFDNKVFKTYEDRFQLTLFPAFILLVIYLLLSDKRSKLGEKLKLYE
jgi:Ca-activated chloride channel family protein